jgi:hypothetical protein
MHNFSGAHTFGSAQCVTFSYRLYNFNSIGNPDPTLNSTYLETLRGICSEKGIGSGTELTNLAISTSPCRTLLTIPTSLIFKSTRGFWRVIESYSQLQGRIYLPLTLLTAIVLTKLTAFFVDFVVYINDQNGEY